MTYTCDSGYLISGQNSNSSTSVCGSDSNWNNTPTCIGKTFSLNFIINSCIILIELEFSAFQSVLIFFACLCLIVLLSGKNL